MSPADTPPSSPVASTLPVTIKQSDKTRPLSNPRIHIDADGVHDFDSRRQSDEPKRLRKLSRRSTPSSLSIGAMSEPPPRNLTDGVETASMRKRLSSLISGADKIQKTPTKGPQEIAEVSDDPLPGTKQELEIRLNYHLSELDILKKTINSANDVIRQHDERYIIFQTRAMRDMEVATKKQEEMIEQARMNRDSFVHFVAFHRKQLERIKHKRIQIEETAGLRPTLPEVYKQMWGDEEWARLFAV